jgi:hypothetical protein
MESRVWEPGTHSVRYIKPYIVFIYPRDWEPFSPSNNLLYIGTPLDALKRKKLDSEVGSM